MFKLKNLTHSCHNSKTNQKVHAGAALSRQSSPPRSTLIGNRRGKKEKKTRNGETTDGLRSGCAEALQLRTKSREAGAPRSLSLRHPIPARLAPGPLSILPFSLSLTHFEVDLSLTVY